MNKVWDTWTPLKPSQESYSIHFPSITGLQTRHGADYADYGGRSNDLVIYTCTVSASMSSSPPVHGARVIGTKKLGPWLKYLQQKYRGISKNHIFHHISSYLLLVAASGQLWLYPGFHSTACIQIQYDVTSAGWSMKLVNGHWTSLE